jgi:hypothetical protein
MGSHSGRQGAGDLRVHGRESGVEGQAKSPRVRVESWESRFLR